MTDIIDTKSTRRPSAKLAAGLAIAAILALGTFAGPASAKVHGVHHGVAHHAVAHHAVVHHAVRANWRRRGPRAVYRAPPVVYGSRYHARYFGAPYRRPPVIYGPGIGISVPGISIGVR